MLLNQQNCHVAFLQKTALIYGLMAMQMKKTISDQITSQDAFNII
jgi:hypothetical protein